MLEIELTYEDGTRRLQSAAPPLTIGRGPQCAVRIANWRVGRLAGWRAAAQRKPPWPRGSKAGTLPPL